MEGSQRHEDCHGGHDKALDMKLHSHDGKCATGPILGNGEEASKGKMHIFGAGMIGYAAMHTACMVACDMAAGASWIFFLDLAPHLCAGFLCLGLLLGRECEAFARDGKWDWMETLDGLLGMASGLLMMILCQMAARGGAR